MYLFINGWAADATVWDSLQPSANCRFFDFTEGVELDKLEAYMAVLAEESGPLQVVGWSMGGMLALELAARHPEQMERLILIDSTTRFTLTEDYAAGMPQAIVRQLARRVRRNSCQAQLNFYQQMFAPGEEAAAETFVKSGAMVRNTTALLAGLSYLEQRDLRGLLPDIALPVRVIHGAEDAICPLSAGKYLAEHLPAGELICLPNGGHVPFYTQSEICRKLIFEGAGADGQ